MSMRVGLGFDGPSPGERAAPNSGGGVEVPFDKGLSGHSDGDVVVHALMDALLGAAALGDKGVHFPSSDPSIKGISSLLLLKRTASLVSDRRWRVVNVDATILAQRPRLGPYIGSMRENLAQALGTDQGGREHQGYHHRPHGVRWPG